jgi:hypothetical protein
MDVLNEAEISELTGRSPMVAKYEQAIDNESAYEMLTSRMEQAAQNPTSTQRSNRKRRTGNV